MNYHPGLRETFLTTLSRLNMFLVLIGFERSFGRLTASTGVSSTNLFTPSKSPLSAISCRTLRSLGPESKAETSASVHSQFPRCQWQIVQGAAVQRSQKRLLLANRAWQICEKSSEAIFMPRAAISPTISLASSSRPSAIAAFKEGIQLVKFKSQDI